MHSTQTYAEPDKETVCPPTETIALAVEELSLALDLVLRRFR